MRHYGMKTFLALAAISLATLLAGATRAEAGYSVVLNSVVPEGANYRFNYSASIATDDTIATGSFFRIYDFYGYVPGSISAPAGWTVSTALLSPATPLDVIIGQGDDATIPNLIFTYTGGPSLSGSATVFGFSALSTHRDTRMKNFAGRNLNSGDGTSVDAVGVLLVPVPEPASVISTSLGVIALGLFYARRRKRAA